jgi:serine/threonine protein kinase/tetratricopeptide (TPR) repeat protein
MIGKTISHYKILEKLGEGGMGVVYKAEDTKLKRTVALKFLPPELTRDPEAKERFIQEAQAASTLDHPNICNVHEIDETADGQLFIVMTCYEGETLKQKTKDKKLKTEEAIDIAMQIAQGLAKAHEQGMIHRDIKPANVMITRDGVAKILDFGLTKLTGQVGITKVGTTLGTTAYMSPEQVRGEDVDHRTDIWSLGAVLYEMVTGVRPFGGEYEPAVVYSILHDKPESMTSRRGDVPTELERIVEKALSKDMLKRYQHIDDMLVDLRTLFSALKTGEGGARTRKKGKKSRVLIAGVAVVVIVVLGIAIIPGLFKPKKPLLTSSSADNRKMLVVLPFENLGPAEDEYFANGTTDAITARLASISGLGVISRQSAMQYKKSSKSIRQIGNELGVDYILEGTVQREKPGDPASRVRVIPQLIRVADDTHVWADTYDESMTEVFHVQSDIAERVAIQLDIALLEPERRVIEKRPTENLAAYENYLRGMDYIYSQNISECEMSVSLFQKAVSLDPQFAEGWAGLAMSYHSLYWVFDRPGEFTLEMQAAKRAQELAPDLPETHLALGFVAYAQRMFDEALAHFERADRQRPSGEAAQAIGFTLRRLGRWQEALTYAEKARRLLPRSTNIYSDILGFTKFQIRRFKEAEQDADHAIWLSPRMTDAHMLKVAVLIQNGDLNTARQAMRQMLQRIETANAAEYSLTQGLTGWCAGMYYRLFPEIFTVAFNAFEAGPIERYRSMQPAMIAADHLGRALIYEALGGRQLAIARYDSARIHFERVIRSNPQSAYVAVYHSDLGLAYAGLGRCDEAIRMGEEAVRLIPISKDAFVGPSLVGNLAEIYSRCGKYELAIDQIQIWLSVPSDISVNLLRFDSIWDPIRNNPRFRRLVEGKQIL